MVRLITGWPVTESVTNPLTEPDCENEPMVARKRTTLMEIIAFLLMGGRVSLKLSFGKAADKRDRLWCHIESKQHCHIREHLRCWGTPESR